MFHTNLENALAICWFRIYISREGINAQVSVPNERIDTMKEYINSLNMFSNLFYNHSVSPGEESFEKLKVKIRGQV
jgi:UPF0176 protein